jgi:hypothetical protein
VVGRPGGQVYPEIAEGPCPTVARLFKNFVWDAQQLRVEGEGHALEKLCVSRSATQHQRLCSPSAGAAVMEQQREQVGEVVKV